MSKKLTVTSNAFTEGGLIPIRHTGHSEDISPRLMLDGIDENAKAIAITLDDASHPLFRNYNHWVIWNIPVQNTIPEGVPHGVTVDELGGAVQGIAYGKHRYKGPKPPFNWLHTYVFTVFVLDCKLDLPASSGKKALLKQIQGHILQQATLSGKFKSR